MAELDQQRGSPAATEWKGYTAAEGQFVKHLESLLEDRGALAALRRGLGKPPGTAVEMHRYVLPWLPAGMPRWEEDACYLVAALFASHRATGGHGNMGTTYRLVAGQSDSQSTEQRFVALLKCDPDDLAHHLRQAVSLAKSKEIPVDYRRLLHDIKLWGHPDQFVQRQWAQEFWSARAVSSKEAESKPEAAKE